MQKVGIMSLIELFESKPFQDVGTFNSIFKKTPILGYSSNCSVEIGELFRDKRKVIVGESDILLLDLTEKKVKVEPKKPKVKNNSIKRIALEKKDLPKIFTILTPTQFMIYEAIKSVGIVDSLSHLSEQIRLERKTISINLKKLEELGLVKKTMVNRGNYFCRISIDNSKNIL